MITIDFSNFMYMDYEIRSAIDSEDKEIHCLFNSPGGDFLDAIAIHNKLIRSGKKVTGCIESRAISAGAVVAMACEHLSMCENAIMMFHLPQVSSYEQKGSAELEELVALLKKSEEMLCTTLASKSGKTKEEWLEALKTDLWFTAEEALAAGLVNEVVSVRRKDVDIEDAYPERIVNHLKVRNIDMALNDVCKQFGIEESESALVNYIKGLQPKPEPNVSESIVNTITRSRKAVLNTLVSDGRCTPAIVNKLEKDFLSTDRVKKDLLTDNSEFDTLTDLLSQNERIINFNGKSGTQKLNKEDSDDNKPDTTLIDDMRNRSAKK